MDARWKRRIGTVVQGVLAFCLLVYAVDWAQMRWRMSRGTAFDSVTVEEYLTTPLKGNKAEYDYMGKVSAACAKSLFPQQGDKPCWWLRRHPTDWQQ